MKKKISLQKFCCKALAVAIIFAQVPAFANGAKDASSKNVNQNQEEITVEIPFDGTIPVTDKAQKTPASVPQQEFDALSAINFDEVWAYLISGEEKHYNKDLPITDIGYFGAGLSTFGKLTGVPKRSGVPETNARVHLVVADNGRALTHFCLDPAYPVRAELIASLIEATKPFDGLQIDFELVSYADTKHFFSFLRELKDGIGKDKILSVAIPARTRTLKEDPYQYKEISQIADKVLVMAYDEHWSGSAPGAVASLDWCKKVASYACQVIPQNKLIMGLPFYGRAWSNDDTAGAYRFSSVERLFRGENAKGKLSSDTVVSNVSLKNEIPSFTVSKNVTYTFYFDNALSLHKRMTLYKEEKVRGVGFWRLGQEDKDVWQKIRIN